MVGPWTLSAKNVSDENNYPENLLSVTRRHLAGQVPASAKMATEIIALCSEVLNANAETMCTCMHAYSSKTMCLTSRLSTAKYLRGAGKTHLHLLAL